MRGLMRPHTRMLPAKRGRVALRRIGPADLAAFRMPLAGIPAILPSGVCERELTPKGN